MAAGTELIDDTECVARIAHDAFGLRAWLWKWRVSKKPPLPPVEPAG